MWERRRHKLSFPSEMFAKVKLCVPNHSQLNLDQKHGLLRIYDDLGEIEVRKLSSSDIRKKNLKENAIFFLQN